MRDMFSWLAGSTTLPRCLINAQSIRCRLSHPTAVNVRTQFVLFLVCYLFARAASCFVPSSSHPQLPYEAKISAVAHITRLHLQGDYLQSLEGGHSLHGQESSSSIPSDDEPTSGSELIGNNDPYAPGVAEKYGLTDLSDTDGFDESSDSVGPGIYGGSVQRDAHGNILIGTQYENHNHKPGPLYDGGGYSLMGRAIHMGEEKVIMQLLNDFPQLLEEISTGGARPLHICGMSPKGQHCTQVLIDAGADIHVVDTYNYNALHRMASNDLDVGAISLVKGGLDPNGKVEGADSTPIEIAKRQRAIKFLMAMQRLGHYD